MSEAHGLETPERAADLYHSRAPETADFVHRPIFTGDVLVVADGRLICMVQHPCAMRQGHKHLPKTLACRVSPFSGSVPVDWGGGHFKRMFLPEMNEQGMHVVDFPDMDLLTPDDLENAERVVIMSAFGVNILLQRWTYHNNRVVIPTGTINIQTSGPFEEADLVAEACDELVSAGVEASTAQAMVDEWLGVRDGGLSHRDRLNDAQARSTVRKALRGQVDGWVRDRESGVS